MINLDMLKNSKMINLYAAFFNNAEIQFMLFDKDLNIIDVNEFTQKFYHIDKNQLIGKHISEVAPDIIKKGLYSKYKEVIRSGEPVLIEDSVTHPKFGNQHNRIKAFKVGEGLGVAALNITEHKNTVDALEFFIMQASHDLRSPVASMSGLASLAISENDNIEDVRNYCTLIKEQTYRMDIIIQKLVETIRIRKAEKEIQLVNFKELLQEVKQSLAFIDGFNTVEFTQNIISTQRFYSDRNDLMSLFQNLIDNAIKYRNLNEKSPYVKITIADDVSGVKIIISDNGIGIPENLQKNVFKMFFRATNQKSSTGLGLYTIFNIVKKLSGHITFNSKEGVGTSFIVHLPVIEQHKILDPVVNTL